MKKCAAGEITVNNRSGERLKVNRVPSVELKAHVDGKLNKK